MPVGIQWEDYRGSVSWPFSKFRRNFLKIPVGVPNGTSTGIFKGGLLAVCPRHFQKSNWNFCQNSTGILTKVCPNFLMPGKKDERTGFQNPILPSLFFEVATAGLHSIDGDEYRVLIYFDVYFTNDGVINDSNKLNV